MGPGLVEGGRPMSRRFGQHSLLAVDSPEEKPSQQRKLVSVKSTGKGIELTCRADRAARREREREGFEKVQARPPLGAPQPRLEGKEDRRPPFLSPSLYFLPRISDRKLGVIEEEARGGVAAATRRIRADAFGFRFRSSVCRWWIWDVEWRSADRGIVVLGLTAQSGRICCHFGA